MEVEGEKGGGDDGSFSPPVVKGKGGLTEEEGASVTGADKTSVSALRENIARKGKNSYYYAHGSYINSFACDEACLDPSPPGQQKVEKITNYAWTNEKEKVKIYVPMEGAGELANDLISLKWENRSLDLEVKMEICTRRLNITSLHDEITGADYRKKQDKLVITMKKKDAITWYELSAR